MQVKFIGRKYVKICKFLIHFTKVFKKNADKYHVRKTQGTKMIKRYCIDSSNVSNTAEMIMRSAKKRRAMAIAAAKSINSDIGLTNKLVAIK